MKTYEKATQGQRLSRPTDMKAFSFVDVDNGDKVLESDCFEFCDGVIGSIPYHRVGIKVIVLRKAGKHQCLLHPPTLREPFVIP
jgi:hypothetical protein